jgi:hypothetical protein
MKNRFWSRLFPAKHNLPKEPAITQAVPAPPDKAPENWYLANNLQKKLTQVVLNVKEKSWAKSRFATLMLAGKYGPLIMNDWITGLFRLDSNSGPFLLVRADGFVLQIIKGTMDVGFSFFKMPQGGVFVLYIAPKPVISGSPHPFIEIVYGLDIEDNRMRIKNTFEKDTLEIVLADRSDSQTTFIETGEKFFNPLAKFDLTVPLATELRETLLREWQNLLDYHEGLPAYKKNHNEAAQTMWDLMPLSQSPILKR